jgi:hypothetical protein
MFSFGGKANATEQPAAYDLGNGYTAVRVDVFDKLVEHDKLYELYKEEVEYNKKKWEELKELTGKKDEIQEERILVLKDTIGLQDKIIEHKDSIITDAKTLYQMKADEVKKYKVKSIWDKALVLGLGAWAISEIDDSSTQMGIGLLTATFVLK